MKPWHLIVAVIAIVGALSLGWFFDPRPSLIPRSLLQVPDNIDYYLADFRYQAMDEDGKPHFELQSPYLEHYIREDISQIRQPFIIYRTDPFQWQVSALQGSLAHQQELLRLEQQVDLQRISGQQPLRLNTEVMILETANDLVEMPEALTLTTDNLWLQADNASLYMNKNYYQFNRVKATYHKRDSHETG